MLENVQIRATKLVDGLGSLDYPERLWKLQLPTLAYRRARGDMIEVYKHTHTIVPYYQDTSNYNPVEAENTIFNLFGICQKTVHEDSRITPSATEQHGFETNSRKKSLTRKT